LLNDASDFEGGGTYFEHLDTAVAISRGDCTLHDSSALHAGHAITSGTRIILVGFVESIARARSKFFENALAPPDDAEHVRTRLILHYARARQQRRQRDTAGVEEQVLENALALLSSEIAKPDQDSGGSVAEDDLSRRFAKLTFSRDKYIVEMPTPRRAWEARAPHVPSVRVLKLCSEELGYVPPADATADENFVLRASWFADLIRHAENMESDSESKRIVVFSIKPTGPNIDLSGVVEALRATEGLSCVEWGQWEVKPFVFSMMQLIIAGKMSQTVDMDCLVDTISSVGSVSSVDVESNTRAR